MQSLPQDYPLVNAEMIDFIRAMVRMEKPASVVETGTDHGQITLMVAQELRELAEGKLLVIDESRSAFERVSAKIKEAGLTNVEIKWQESARFSSPGHHDMAIFHSLYFDHEEEFYFVMKRLKPGATVIMPGYTQNMPYKNNLPLRLQQAGLLTGQFFTAPHGVYVGKYTPAVNCRQERIILCLSAGRSGTALVSTLLQGLKGVVSLHEPEPRYQINNLKLQDDPAFAQQFMQQKKLPWLKHVPCKTYIETSHYICKGFMEAWLENSPVVPDLLALTRPARQIAASWYGLGVSFTNDKEFALQHMLHPQDKRRLFLDLPDWQHYNDYQLCYWYALEMEKRKGYYIELFVQKGASAHSVALQDISDASSLQALARFVSPQSSEEDIAIMKKRVSYSVNHKHSNKDNGRQQALAAMNLDELEQQVLENVRQIR